MSYSRFVLGFGRFLSLYYIIAAFTLVLSQNWFPLAWYNLYFDLLLLLIGLAFWLPERASLEGDFKLKGPVLWTFLALGLGLFLYRSWYLHETSLWVDELTQATHARDHSPMYAAGLEHQPPLDYLLSAFGQKWLGVSEWGIRFHTMLMNVLSALLLFLLSYRITRSLILSLGLNAFYVFHHAVTQFSFEARPISCGLMQALLFLIYLDWRPSWPKLAAATTLLLLSLGFQAPFLALSVTVAFFLLGSRKQVLPVGLGVLLYLPVQFYIFQISPPRLHGTQGEWEEIFLGVFSHLDLGMLRIWPLPEILFASLLVALVYRLYSRPKNSHELRPALAVTLALLLFWVSSIGVFQTYIGWYHWHYYTILALPLALLALAYTWRSWQESGVAKQWFVLTLLAMTLSLSTGRLLFDPSPLRWGVQREFSRSEDLRPAYEFLKAHSTQEDWFFSLSLPVNRWAPFRNTFGADVYFTNQTQHASGPLNQDMPQWLLERLDSREEPRRIYILFFTSWSDVKLSEDFLRGLSVKVHPFMRLSVLEFDNSKGDWKSLWFHFLDQVAHLPKAEESGYFQELRLQQALVQKDSALYQQARERFFKHHDDYDPQLLETYQSRAQTVFRLDPIAQF